MSDPGERVPLDLYDSGTLRNRARIVGLGALVVAGFFGGVVGLFGGTSAGLITAAVVALPLLLLAFSESRRHAWLQGTTLHVRVIGIRVVDLRQATNLDVLISDVRGARTISLLISGGPAGKTLNVPVAIYSGTGGRELGILALRRLADALASTGDTRALVLSELLVAQLRAEARGEAAADRPLYQLASAAPSGRIAQKLNPDAVARFVATLD